MKQKSLGILAVAAILIIAILYVAPAMTIQTLGINYSVSPGKATITMTSFKTYTQTVTVVNSNTLPVTVSLTSILPKSKPYEGYVPIPLTTWVSGPTSLVVPAKKTVTATFSINIPKSQAYVGKHYEVWIKATTMPMTMFNIEYNLRWMIDTPTKVI
jgi:hypothetical protein